MMNAVLTIAVLSVWVPVGWAEVEAGRLVPQVKTVAAPDMHPLETGEWSDWGVCSVTCGGGVQYRTCKLPPFTTGSCIGASAQLCANDPCPHAKDPKKAKCRLQYVLGEGCSVHSDCRGFRCTAIVREKDEITYDLSLDHCKEPMTFRVLANKNSNQELQDWISFKSKQVLALFFQSNPQQGVGDGVFIQSLLDRGDGAYSSAAVDEVVGTLMLGRLTTANESAGTAAGLEAYTTVNFAFPYDPTSCAVRDQEVWLAAGAIEIVLIVVGFCIVFTLVAYRKRKAALVNGRDRRDSVEMPNQGYANVMALPNEHDEEVSHTEPAAAPGGNWCRTCPGKKANILLVLACIALLLPGLLLSINAEESSPTDVGPLSPSSRLPVTATCFVLYFLLISASLASAGLCSSWKKINPWVIYFRLILLLTTLLIAAISLWIIIAYGQHLMSTVRFCTHTRVFSFFACPLVLIVGLLHNYCTAVLPHHYT